jgi:tRNA(Ile)-lysidine synthase
LPVWDDPHNTDPRFTRARLRHDVLPLLEEVLAGGVVEALGRTATQLREDAAALDELAAGLLDAARDGSALLLPPLVAAHPAVRRRALRAWLLGTGVPALTDAQLRAADALAATGPDRVGGALAGGLELVREHGRLTLRPASWSTASPLPREDGHRVRR